jgi:gas vesicle protein
MTDELTRNKSSMLISFLVGGVVGAGVALLLAPKAGKEVRDDIKRFASDTQDRVTHAIDEGKELYNEGKSVISNAIEAGKTAYVNEKEKWQRAA